MRLRSGEKHHLRKSADRKAQIRKAFFSAHRTYLCFSICRFSQVVFIHRAQPHAQSLFLFPIVFGINLINFFDEEKDGVSRKFDRLFRCSDPLSRHLTEPKPRMRIVSKSTTFLATESVNSAPFRRERLRCTFLARKSATLFANTKVQTFWQGKVQNSSPISALLR